MVTWTEHMIPYLGHSLTTFQDTEFCLYERKICDKHFICYSSFN